LLLAYSCFAPDSQPEIHPYRHRALPVDLVADGPLVDVDQVVFGGWWW